jgi:hypothetical protein
MAFQFVIVGATALVLHGSSRLTRGLDICYARGRRDLRALAAALSPFSPVLGAAPAALPFRLDVPTLESGLNFTLTTSAGDLDLLGEVTGLGGFGVVARLSDEMEVYGRRMRVLSLDGLERAKKAAGRLKDLVDLAEIAEIRRQRKP